MLPGRSFWYHVHGRLIAAMYMVPKRYHKPRPGNQAGTKEVRFMIINSNDIEFFKVNMDEVYDWEVGYSHDPYAGLDEILTVNGSVNKILKVVMFMARHLRKEEVIQITLITPERRRETEVVITANNITYLNSLSDLYNHDIIDEILY